PARPKSSVEAQPRRELVVIHACEIVFGIDLSCPAKEEFLERLERAGAKRIKDPAEGNPRRKALRAGNRHQREVVREYSCAVGNEVMPSEGDVGIAAREHFGKIAMHDAEASGKTRHLRREERVSAGLAEEFLGGRTALDTNVAQIRQRNPGASAQGV